MLKGCQKCKPLCEYKKTLEQGRYTMSYCDKPDYESFIDNKIITVKDAGFDIEESSINPILFPFQRWIVKQAIKKGRYAIFADCGLGKTFMQIEWARLIGGNCLIVAPLCVAQQTIREGKLLGVEINYCKTIDDFSSGINITNYDRITNFEGISGHLKSVVLDESSILKSYAGKIKTFITDLFSDVQYKLCCTATPSPNNHMELLNHAEFLGILKSHLALALWFRNDTQCSGNYVLKDHARQDFWRWVSSWAVCISNPSHIGYPQDGYDLPELKKETIVVQTEDSHDYSNGEMFRSVVTSATGYHVEKRLSAPNRAAECKKIIDTIDGQVIIWCETDYESDALKAAIPDGVIVKGSDKAEYKEQATIDFQSGRIRILITKPSIYGYGINFQNCNNMIFCGLSFSFESYYQATRRLWRFGQKKTVNSWAVIGDGERAILDTLNKKEESFMELQDAMSKEYASVMCNGFKRDYDRQEIKTENYHLINGDSCQEIKVIPNESIDFMIYSPPFSQLYCYSGSFRDMGNCKNDDEFMTHYEYLIPETYRILKSGRNVAVHCKNLVDYKSSSGRAGLRDFRGEIIRAHERHGFKYHSEILIWKCPVTEMQRTKAHGLLWKQLRKDSSYSRQGLPDYLVIFRKWGDEDVNPVIHTKEEVPLDWWQDSASPVWFEIDQMNVLNRQAAKEGADEKHICPLQLDVIERAVKLWSKEGDTVFSPFAGIGSEGYQSILMGRKFMGIELKESYYKQAIINLNEASRIAETKKIDLITMMND